MALIFPFTCVDPIRVLSTPLLGGLLSHLVGLLIDALVQVEVNFAFDKFGLACRLRLLRDQLLVLALHVGSRSICGDLASVILGTHLSHD